MNYLSAQPHFYMEDPTLQPLVENAINHAFKDKGKIGRITIKGFFDRDDIVVQVIDNGTGINEYELDKLNSGLKDGILNNGQGYGLYNVNARLRINQTSHYGVRISSKLGEGTVAGIIIPQEV